MKGYDSLTISWRQDGKIEVRVDREHYVLDSFDELNSFLNELYGEGKDA